ncbi:MAG: methyl-accepting chemotaxis protein [Treponemataceae bacterium]
MKIGYLQVKLALFTIFFILLTVTISIAISFVTINKTLAQATKESILDTAMEKKLNFNSVVDKEILLALKMADSPLIAEYFSNPADGMVKSLALQELDRYQDHFSSQTIFWVNDKDHQFFRDGSYLYTVNINDPNEYWYHLSLLETPLFNLNINYNQAVQQLNLWVNVVARRFGNPVGVLGSEINITEFTKKFLKEDDLFNVYLFNEMGEVTVSSNISHVEKKDSIYSLFPDPSLLKQNLNQNNENGSFFAFKIDNKKYSAALASLGQTNWNVVVFKEDSLSFADSALFVPFFCLIILLILSFVAFNFYVLKVIINPIAQLNDEFILLGDGNLTSEIKMQRKDEIGFVAKNFNHFVSSLHKTMQNISASVSKVVEVSSNLAEGTKIAKDATKRIDSDIGIVNEQIESQGKNVIDASGTIDQIAGNVSDLNAIIERQSESLDSSSAAVEQMIANINSVTSTLDKSKLQFDNLFSLSETGNSLMTDMQTQVIDIATKSQGMSEANAIIQSIATQTNLLAMNAAIEAAHAGEAGKGFAVVADEIRKLAEDSAEQSKSISTTLHVLLQGINSVVESSETASASFQDVRSAIEHVATLQLQIKNAMDEQSIGNSQISQSFMTIRDLNADVRKGSSQMLQGSQSITLIMQELVKVTTLIKDSMGRMKEGTIMINEAVQTAMELTEENKKETHDLKKRLDKFTL